MENSIKIRKMVFDEMMSRHGNKRNWEMLCCSDKPLVPFIGAGMSAWCYPTWNQLLKKIVVENFPEICGDIVEKALKCPKAPDLARPDAGAGQTDEKIVFHWMEEIAECIFDDNENSYKADREKYRLAKNAAETDENMVFRQLREYVGEESPKKKREAVKALYAAFDTEKLRGNRKMPEYQEFFPKLFSDILVTTNYDKALESCYPSIFSYSYMDLNKEYREEGERSWLFRAVDAKLTQMQRRINGTDTAVPGVSVPDIPMLLKVHGSIEQASNIVLSRAKYEEAYRGEMPMLFKEICQRGTLVFMGCGIQEDRILDVMKELKGEENLRHFAFYPIPEEGEEKARKHLQQYGIYPIFYEESDLKVLFSLDAERKAIFHDYCLGLLLENLMRRKMCYPQPLELLWDQDRFWDSSVENYLTEVRRKRLMQKEPPYTHLEEALQIWNLLNDSNECPLIAIAGDVGSGTSTLCRNIQRLCRSYKDALQFLNISLSGCKSWDEFCIRIFLELNISGTEIPEPAEWRTVGKLVEERCGSYWRSVLVLDGLGELKDGSAELGLWELVKNLLEYWKEHKTRVVFTCRDYPKGIPCHVWQIGELKQKDAVDIFFGACTSKGYRNISFLEKNIIFRLFARQAFPAASAYLLGRYANSKNDLSGLLDEWELCHKPGDSGRQVLARMIWKYLLDEHKYEEENDPKKRWDIEENILWIWGILGEYPGAFPSVLLENALESDWKKLHKDSKLSGKTLRFMKNAGLCEEREDEKRTILLENIVWCADTYFLKILENYGEKYKGIREEFRNSIEESDRSDRSDRTEYFRSYFMYAYNGGLRECICEELERDTGRQSRYPEEQREHPREDILQILGCLGKKINSDDERKANRKLDMVIRYEIGKIISFLCTYLSLKEIPEGKEQEVAEIGYCFLHYFHYAPDYAYPLVKQLLKIMDNPCKDQIYKLANVTRVMGDIHRLLGRKKEAVFYYKKALALCDKQMLLVFETNHDAYKKSQRTKASILASIDYFNDGKKEYVRDKREAGNIYQEIGDSWREAENKQILAEGLFIKACSDNTLTAEKLDEIAEYYNASVRTDCEVGNKQGMAHTLKCMGDLVGKFRKTYEEGNYSLCRAGKEGTEYYTIERKGGIQESRGDWRYASACFYAKAFVYYYNVVDWRGFSNILQAMGTTVRRLDNYNKDEGKDSIHTVEELYGLAEECFRWMGDIRGLADTLDYFGYAYKECEEETYRYMALGKWMESKEVWKKQGNEGKEDDIDKAIKQLRENIFHGMGNGD